MIASQFTPCPKKMEVRACGCVVHYATGHTHTKFCEQHYRECFNRPRTYDNTGPSNLDLIGG